MLIFFLLGLLVFPSMLLPILGTALLIFLGLTFIARPVAVFLVMTPFRSSWRQQALTAFAGLRGAASAVFAIIAVNNPGYGGYDVYNIVFCVAVISVAFQGLLLPAAATSGHCYTDSNQDGICDHREGNDRTCTGDHCRNYTEDCRGNGYHHGAGHCRN